jgi:hypothetical protein
MIRGVTDYATDPTDDRALIMEVLFEIRGNVRTIRYLLEEDDGEDEEGDEAPDS